MWCTTPGMTAGLWSLVLFLLVGPLPQSPAEESHAPLIITDDKAYPPFAFLDTDGYPRGITIDIWNLWSRKTGIPVTFQLTDWDSALIAVIEGRADAVGGLFRTSARESDFEFTKPILEIPTGVFFHHQIAGIKELKDLQGFRVGVIKGDSGEELLRTKFPTIDPVAYPGADDLVQAAVNGEIKVFVADEPIALFYLAQYQKGGEFQQSIGDAAVNLQYTAVRKGNSNLLTTLQSGFDQIPQSELDAIVNEWAGRPTGRAIPWKDIAIALTIIFLITGTILFWNFQLRRQILKATRYLTEQNRELEASREALQKSTEELRQSENLNRALFDQTFQFLALLTREGLIIRINQTGLEFSGLTLPQVKGTPFHEGPWWPDHDESAHICKAAYQTALEGQTYCHAVQHVNQHGDIFYIDFSISPFLDENGAVSYLIAEGRDITGMHRAQEALINSERRFHAIFDNAPYSIAINRFEDGVYLDVNKAFLEGSGLPKDTILGLRSQDLFPLPEKGREVILDELLKYGVVRNREITVPKHNGSLAHLIFSSVLLEIQGQREVLSMTVDVTEKKQAEEALRESEHQFRSITESAFDLICLVDMNGCYLYCNPTYETILGYPPSSLIGKNSLLLVHPSERAKASILFRQGLESGQNRARVTLRLMCQDGSSRWVDHRVALIADEHGNPQKILIMGQDISERIQAEAERDRLMAAIEQAEEILVITDPEGIVQYVNPAFERITGYTRAEVIGQNPRLLKSGKHDESFYAELWQTIMAGKTWKGRFINKRKDGTHYTEEAVISPVFDASDQIVNFVAAKHDITGQLALEEQYLQAQKMEALGQLTGGVAHDFNNLLQVINGYTGMAMMDIATEDPVQTLLKEVDKAGHRAAALVQQLLIFSRRQVMQPKYMDINALVTDLIKMLGRVIGEHIRLDWLPGNNLGVIFADSGMLGQVLMNLCVNARDAMPNGGVLTIQTQRTEIDQKFCDHHLWAKPGHFALLILSDTGCGMTKEILDHIFEPFFTTKSEGKGTGLGLSTVYGIVKQHNGMVNVYSEVGKGTSFKVYLPLCESQPENQNTGAEKVAVGGNEVILLAEDDEMVRNLATTILEKAGYTVLAARDGNEAIEVFKQNPTLPDLLLLDVVMPHLSGQGALEQILEIRPNIPSLFASGYSDGAVHTDFVLHEGLRLIGKPYTSSTLLRAVREALDAGKAGGGAT